MNDKTEGALYVRYFIYSRQGITYAIDLEKKSADFMGSDAAMVIQNAINLIEREKQP